MQQCMIRDEPPHHDNIQDAHTANHRLCALCQSLNSRNELSHLGKGSTQRSTIDHLLANQDEDITHLRTNQPR